MTTFVIRSTIDRRPKPQPGFFARVIKMLTLWRERSAQRQALAGLSEYQLHDIGLSRSQVSYEIEKPFWRV
jgi:uncharacterized protein YjiS (DUF1127 family)